MADPAAVRRNTLLDAATGVFIRYGFKKTSMDDLARAVGLSRQGLYLHFATKEAIFKDAVLRLLETSQTRARAALTRDDLDVEARILGAFTAMHGVMDGLSAQHMAELLETSARLLGPVVTDFEQSLVTEVARVLRTTGVAARWKDAGMTATELAGHLHATSTGLKNVAVTAADYHDRMRTAVRIVCRGAAG